MKEEVVDPPLVERLDLIKNPVLYWEWHIYVCLLLPSPHKPGKPPSDFDSFQMKRRQEKSAPRTQPD
ncbi:hypothetical protein [Bradyrhizobium sp. BWA-3-5]|uniref:hypothetical protein n=1 Tax=Bradyrhizobium sp. BWA-3-5 TaxID=3080013 RepID=UPI00293F3D72|nr:hypothetical protein [Bradyrhizobium sp. BWA-3-5]WOH64013.1 hypothetical protein RX331_25755 [Bradyrhizobium sp. BWA-3-5]